MTIIKEQPIAKTPTCSRHPHIETRLRCNKCERYMCQKCLKLMDVGYRCVECLRSQQDKFFTGGLVDYVIASFITLPLSLLAAFLFTFIIGSVGWWFSWFIAFSVAPVVSGLIAESVRWTVRRRRSRYLAHVVSACLILAVIPFLLLPLLLMDFLSGAVGNLYGYGFIEPGILVFVGTGTIMARLR